MGDSPVILRTLKRLVPARLKRAAKEALLERTFGRALRQVAALPLGEVPSRRLLEELQVGWGNEGFAARSDYLEEVARRAASVEGPILECGSGLTTMLLGLLAGRRGIETWSLEHIPQWHARVTATLERYRIPKVRVCLAPLRDYEGFSWYDPPLAEMPGDFRLVVCDGPPGATLGGRYGLLPVMGERLNAGSLVMLDDANREGETEVLNRWSSETPMSVAMRETSTGAFALVTRG